jgi:hypothetical protein
MDLGMTNERKWMRGTTVQERQRSSALVDKGEEEEFSFFLLLQGRGKGESCAVLYLLPRSEVRI